MGYSQAEFFLSGSAHSYSKSGLLNLDGMWDVTPNTEAAYKTRIVVYRPIDAQRFNGTVIVEWLNVSGGLDAAPDWLGAHTELIRDGFAWVGVSAQALGVEGGPSLLGLPVIPLKTIDPTRYGTLIHPGDSFSYDIYSQAAQAIRRPANLNPLGDLKVSAVIAAGESQSAFRMVTYINAIHPHDDIYDGFMVHSRGSTLTAPLAESPLPVINVPGATKIRDDLNVPVFTFETETDLSFLQYVPARQADTERFRLWEVAGTAHADTYTTVVGSTDVGNSPDAANIVVTSTPVAGFTCNAPINSGPHHFVLNAAFKALNEWVRHGTPPPTGALIETTGTTAARIRRDANGNARGGIRTPQVDVPIAQLSGEGQMGSIFCALFGTTALFDAAKLASLYPTHESYVSAYDAATDRAVQAGFLLPADGELMKAAAAQSSIGR
ncbi:MAG: hypothetical protein HY270_24000 [Deltaproteobacteria bacterium]|nr:hypothetical protein [Deltaproteobacteria bacterium]